MAQMAAGELSALLPGTGWRLTPGADVPFQPPDRGVIFYHVPKCAGMTANYALKWAMLARPFGPGMFVRVDWPPLIRPEAAYDGMTADQPMAFIGTHNSFGLHKLAPNPVETFTVLREPRGRLVSHYTYHCMRNDERPTVDGLLRFIEDPSLQNIVTRTFSGDGEEIGPASVDKAVDTILNRLDRVVMLDRLDALISHYLVAYCTPNVLMRRANETLPQYRLDITGIELPAHLDGLDKQVIDRITPVIAARPEPVAPPPDRPLHPQTVVVEEKQRPQGSIEAAHLLDTEALAAIIRDHDGVPIPPQAFRAKALRSFVPDGFDAI